MDARESSADQMMITGAMMSEELPHYRTPPPPIPFSRAFFKQVWLIVREWLR